MLEGKLVIMFCLTFLLEIFSTECSGEKNITKLVMAILATVNIKGLSPGF